MEQAVLDHFELQLSDRTDNLTSVELVGKKLGDAFIHQLLDALVQLLGLHRIGILDIFEHFRRETRQSFEMKFFTGSQRITDLEVSGIRQTDDIAGKSLVHHFLLLRHESCRTAETHHLSETDMLVVGITFETSGTNLHESNTTAMVRVHIGMDLENEAGESILFRIDHPFHSRYRTGRRSDIDKAIQQLFHPEVIQGRTKKHGSNISFQISIDIEFRINPFYQFDIGTELFCLSGIDIVFKFRAVDILKFHILRHILLARSIEIQFLFIYIIDATEPLSHVDRPAQRAHIDMQLLFDLVQQVERVLTVAVHLIDKHDHGSLTHTADFHQLTGLGFHTFCGIDHDNNAIHSRQRTKRIFSEILVAGRIEDIDFMAGIIESHHGGCDGDSTLLFNFHPVGGSCLLDLVRLYGSCHMNGTSKEQQFFGKSRLTGIRVADNSKRSSSLNLF